MGMFFRPRRPLMRLAAGAATATVAYNAGRNRAEQQRVNEEAEDAYAAQRAYPQQYQQPPPQAPPPQQAPPAADPLDELERLAKLHDSGAIDDDEFAAMKSRLIGR